MSSINRNNIAEKLYKYSPLILLFAAVLNEFDFNNTGLKYFSFNFVYILIFYFSLKKSDSLGYGLIFIAGLFNDVVVGMPIGISSLGYLFICGAASYLRNITLRPSLMKDWIFFLITILIINSFTYLILTFYFDYEIDFLNQSINITCTFAMYLFFSLLFNKLKQILLGKL